jgi:acetoacetyl-CoA synthetase
MSGSQLWSPDPARIANSRMRGFIQRWYPEFGEVGQSEGVGVVSHGRNDNPRPAAIYPALHRLSIQKPARFWSAVADFCGLQLSRPPEEIVADFDRMPGTRWFEGATLNYAENLLETARPGPAIVFVDERGTRRELDNAELKARVAAVAAGLRAAGVGPGDRVAGILPNTPECIIAALGTASIGAVWSSCSPDFGASSLLDRLGQLAPKVLFGVDGYT